MDIISHPSAWKGKELFENNDFSIQLPDLSIKELINSLSNLPDDFTKIRIDSADCPTLRNVCLKIRGVIESGAGITRIENFPLQSDIEKTKKLFFYFGSLVGTPVSQSPKGDLIMSVIDQGYKFNEGQMEARGSNSNQSLPFHTDVCDVLSFLCINNAMKGGDNFFVSSVAIQNEMAKTNPELLKVLYQDFYLSPQKFDVANKNKIFKVPVFSRIGDHFSSFYIYFLIELAQESNDVPKLTKLQKEALNCLGELANSEKMKIRYRQNSGEVIFINNHVIYHAREAFDDSDGNKRHLLRLWLSTPNNRPLIENYRSIYNNIESGKIRGGIDLEIST